MTTTPPALTTIMATTPTPLTTPTLTADFGVARRRSV
jgi:hypothetical protein